MKKPLVIMSDNRQLQTNKEDADYYSLCVFINSVYCKKNGYDFIFYHVENNTYGALLQNIWNILKTSGLRTWFKKFVMGRGFIGAESPVCYNTRLRQYRSASWAKIIAAKDALSLNNSAVVYLDSDCIFRDQQTTIEEFTAKAQRRSGCSSFDESVIGFLNNYPNNADTPCCGFFVLKNNPDGISLLSEWWNLSNPYYNLKFYFEQASMEKLYPHNRDSICLWDEKSFVECEGQFIRHICNFEHDQRHPYFLKIVNNLEAELNVKFEDVINGIKIRSLINPAW